MITTRRQLLISGLALPVVVAAGAFAFAWSGLYSVAATQGHMRVTAWFLHFGMRQSVKAHAASIDPPVGFDTASMVERAAGHFALGCAPCHGAPGVPPSPIAQQMLPAPPSLSEVAKKWEPAELFWIVRHGIKYAGMPAWPAPIRVDEAWAMTAFLLEFAELTPEGYRELAFPALAPEEPEPASLLSSLEGARATCAWCHGPDGLGGPSGGVPKLAGQRSGYLRLTLNDYRSGSRPSGIMGPIAAFLDDTEILEIAAYYEELDQEPTQVFDVDAALLQLGGALAVVGDTDSRIPPCSSCHGEGGRARRNLPDYPALAGQHAPYLEQQLRLWRAGSRGGTYNNIMAGAVRNISDEQIVAVALYYSRLRPNRHP